MKKRHQHGFTLIELLASLAIGTAMLLGLSTMIDTSIRDMKGLQAAAYHAQITDAAARYISENYATLATAANTAVTTAVPMTTLVTAGLLPNGFQATNAYGQTPCLLFRAGSRTSGGSTVFLVNALVVTEGTAAQQIPDGEISVIAANAGKGGGAITARNPNVAQGAFGSWQINGATSPTLADFQTTRCSANTFSQGSLTSALFFDGPDNILTEFLYRSPVAGRPELNQMNTPLRLGSAAIVTEGTACDTSVAALAADAANNLMYCDSATGTWTAMTMWKSPVPTYASLPATAMRDEVRMVSDLNRAFTYTGSSWVALAVDQNNNLRVPGNIDVGTIGATGDIYSAANLRAGANVNAGNNVSAGNVVWASVNVAAGNDVIAARDVTSSRNVLARTGVVHGREVLATQEVAAGALTLSDGLWGNKHLVAGSACHLGPFTAADGTIYFQWPIGTTIVDANGITMNCAAVDKTFRYQNGTYTP